MMRYLILAAMLAAGGVPAPIATITKPKARAVTGGTCRLATNGTFGGNFGPSASLPTLALTIGPGAAMADQLHAMFQMAKKRAGITGSFPQLSKAHFRRPLGLHEQLGLWSS